MSNFQLILTSIFGLFILIGVIFFASYGSKDKATQEIGSVTIWGTIEEKIIKEVLDDLTDTDEKFKNVKYLQKDKETFDIVLAEAMAEDKGPDLFFIPSSKIIKHQNKILSIPYDTFSERDFKDYFIEEGELYLSPNGILALPFLVDPLVMYWNRDIMTRNGISDVPKYWESFFSFAKKVTEKDQNMNILTSAVALGSYDNIMNAKEILATLFLQTGNPIITRDGEDFKVVFKNGITDRQDLSESALRFYTEFSDAVKDIYSWNSSIGNSKNIFLAGDLALYFGFASEMEDIKNKNINLNFDVSIFPQSSNTKNFVTFGKMQALAINKGSKNISGAYSVAMALIKTDTLRYLGDLTGLPPVSRILLSEGSTDPYREIFNKSALASRAFLDIDEKETDYLFQDMVTSVVSGRRDIGEAIRWTDSSMWELLK